MCVCVEVYVYIYIIYIDLFFYFSVTSKKKLFVLMNVKSEKKKLDFYHISWISIVFFFSNLIIIIRK